MKNVNDLEPGVHMIDDTPVTFVNTDEVPSLLRYGKGWYWCLEVKEGEKMYGPYFDMKAAFSDACLFLTGTKFEEGTFMIQKAN